MCRFLYHGVAVSLLAAVLLCALVKEGAGHPKGGRSSLLSSGGGRSFGYSSKFGKGSYNPHYRSYGSPASHSGGKSSTKLLTIVLCALFGIGAAVLLIIVCSKMTKKQSYDPVNGSAM